MSHALGGDTLVRKGRRAGWIVTLMALACAGHAGSALAAEGSPRPAPPAQEGTLVGWKSLHLEAHKAVLFSGDATFEVSEATHEASGRPAVRLKTRSRATILGAMGFEEETTSYIDRDSHRPLEFFQLRAKDSARRYLFLDGFVRQTTWEPPEARRETPFSEWREVETKDRRLTLADGSPPRDGERPMDFYSLIFLMRDLDLSAPAPAPREFLLLYRRHLIRIQVVPSERREMVRTAINDVTGAQETLRLRERRIMVRPLGEDAASFRGFLGMQGETEIWLDEASGAPVEVNGSAPGGADTQVLLTSFSR